MKKLLLVSGSSTHGTGYLDHCEPAVRRHFAEAGDVLFVPYALHDRDAYAAKARARFAEMGLELRSVHAASDPRRAVLEAGGFFVGGGNTFRLLKTLYDLALVEALRERALAGVPFMGASAGSNLAGPTIRTTNDMPIVYPPSFDALGLVPFQINPHYLDPDPSSTHMGETRETRIREFHEENATPVVGLREGAWVEVAGERMVLAGRRGARLFRRGQEPVEVVAGTELGALLAQ